MKIYLYVKFCFVFSRFGYISLFFFIPLLRVLSRKWNGCFELNLLQAREFLPSPIFSYFAFIIIISIQHGLAHILLSPTSLLHLQSSFPFPQRLSLSVFSTFYPRFYFFFLHVASG